RETVRRPSARASRGRRTRIFRLALVAAPDDRMVELDGHAITLDAAGNRKGGRLRTKRPEREHAHSDEQKQDQALNDGEGRLVLRRRERCQERNRQKPLNDRDESVQIE